MDSLTQLTLGAAVGEAVLGKKIGNRAMLWGAFGGLLPDFDVFARFFMDDLGALAFHRGFMHSILFAIIAAAGMAWLTNQLYRTATHRKTWYKTTVTVFILGIYTLLFLGLRMILDDPMRTPLAYGLGLGIGGLLAFFIWKRYISRRQKDVEANFTGWYWLFFWSIVTHPILDCFTAYGTQLFLPFSDVRVSWDNISVVDFGYTVPLAIGVIVASLISRNKKSRRIANWTGIAVSSLYMAFTFSHKARFNDIFEKSLAENGIEYSRYMTAPTILQNFLWLGVAEGEDAYYHGYYSFMSKEPQVKKFTKLDKNWKLLDGLEDTRPVKIVQWFSKGYYNALQRKDGRLQINDLRYGSFNDTFENENDYIFKFILEKKNGEWTAEESRAGREIDQKGLQEYFDRVMGK